MAIDISSAFVSYSRVDSDFALRLAEDLRSAGAKVWLDQIELEPGRPWDVEIERALGACTKMLVILSPTSVNSTNVLDEVSFALSKRKTVIPVLYQDCEIPLRLHRLQYVNLTANYTRGLGIIVKALAEPARPEPPIPVQGIPDRAGPATPPSITPPNPAPPPAAPAAGDSPQAQRQLLSGLDAILNADRKPAPASPPEPPRPASDAGILDGLSQLISRPGR